MQGNSRFEAALVKPISPSELFDTIAGLFNPYRDLTR